MELTDLLNDYNNIIQKRFDRIAYIDKIENIKLVEIFEKFCKKMKFKNDINLAIKDISENVMEINAFYVFINHNSLQVIYNINTNKDANFSEYIIYSHLNYVNVLNMRDLDSYFKNLGIIYKTRQWNRNLYKNNLPDIGCFKSILSKACIKFDNYNHCVGVWNLKTIVIYSDFGVIYKQFKCRDSFFKELKMWPSAYAPIFIKKLNFKQLFEQLNVNPYDKKIREKIKILMAVNI